MKNFLKILGYICLVFITIAYICFLFVLPNAVDLNVYKQDVQKLAKDYGKVTLDFDNAKILATPALNVGLKVDNISVKLPDETVLFSADNFKGGVSIPSLLTLTVKVTPVEINKPYINLEIANDKQFKIVQLVEDILNDNKAKTFAQPQKEPVETWFNPACIKIKVPNVVVNNYGVLINDLKSKHYLKLQGEKLQLGYFNGKTAKIKTLAEFYSDENKNITANIDINTFIPASEPSLDSEDDPAERIKIPFVNPVTMYRNYDLKANLDTKLKVRNHKDGITSYGYFNVDGVTLKISNLVLPESYFHAKTFSKTVDLDTNIYPIKDEHINILGKLNYGKHPKMDMSIKTAEIKFNDLIILAKSVLDSLAIPNELSNYTATGTLKADCYVKTNFKKLKSNGSIIINNGGLNIRRIGKVLANANINLLLENNILDIKDSSLFVNNSKVTIDGKIDDKSVADIKINADKVPLPILFNAFAPKEVRNAYNFLSGNFSLSLNLMDELKFIKLNLKAGLDNLIISDRARTFVINNKKLSTEVNADAKTLIANLKNEGLMVNLPMTHSNISIPIFETDITDNNIVIKENKINFNDKSTITYSGNITNYNKLENINFVAQGGVSTDDIIKLIGREFKSYIHHNGEIPVKLTIDGNSKKQTLFAQALSDKSNFFTPVDMDELQGKNLSLQSIVVFKGNRIKIKKTGIYERNLTKDEEGNEIIELNDILDIDGTIAGDTINLLKINMPNSLSGKIFVFPRSRFTVNGKAYVFGEIAQPRIIGGFDINNLSIPELLLNLKNGNLTLTNHNADFSLTDLVLNGSDIQLNGHTTTLPSSVFNISNLNIASRYMNVDKAMQVVDRAMKYVPASNSASTSSHNQTADIPARMNGKINFVKIVSGNINVNNTTGRISLDRNIFRLNNLNTNVFEGQVNGDISMNLLTSLLGIQVNGKGLNVDKAMQDAAGMKDMLSGKADFSTDISLSGSTYEEQMKSLDGSIDFTVKNGQFGPFGKLENLIIAENIRESAFFKTALGGIISGLLTIDTTHFSDLSGHISFTDGVCHLDPITSLGNILSLHIFGDFDLLRNYADMKVRARMASLVSNLLGPIGAINPANMINSVASTNVVTAKAFSIFCEMVPESEIAILPSFSNKYVDNSATKFQIVVRGDVAQPLKLVKSFKWLATETEYNNAVDYVNSLPEPIEGSTATTVEEIMAERKAYEAEKETMTYKVKSVISKDWANSDAAKNALQEVAEQKVEVTENKTEEN